jgi:hypothetical protein
LPPQPFTDSASAIATTKTDCLHRPASWRIILSSSADDRHHVRLVSFDETSTTERMQHGSEDLRQNHVVIALILARVGRTRITFVPAIGG